MRFSKIVFTFDSTASCSLKTNWNDYLFNHLFEFKYCCQFLWRRFPPKTSKMKECVFEGPYNRNRKDASKKLIAVLVKILIAFTVFLTHHNQLLMTKFGRSLFLTWKWRQLCSLLQVNAPLTEKTWGRGWVVFVVKTKMADTSLVSRVRTTAGTRRNNG